MSKNFNKGWEMAVRWIYDSSVKSGLSKGINPMGKYVSERMRNLPKEKGYDAGFAEGLIYAIHTPITELKEALER